MPRQPQVYAPGALHHVITHAEMALWGIAGSVNKGSLLQLNLLLCNNMNLIAGFHSNRVFFQMNPKDFENSSVDSPKKEEK